MDWNDIRLIVEVARSGSFSRAAETLNINKATVSRRIGAIETAAGAPLFRREPSGAVLTPIGEGLLCSARRVDEQVELFRRDFELLGRQASAPVGVRASEGVGTYLLTPLMAGQEVGPLAIANAQVRATLPAMALLQPADPEKAEIEVVWTPPEATPVGRNDERVVKLARINFVPFLGEKYARKLRHGPSRFDDLRQLDLVTLRTYKRFPSDGALGSWIDLVAGCRRSVEANWTAAMAELTLGGSGVSLLPDYSVLYSRGLLRIEAPSPHMACDLWLKADVDDLRNKRVRKCFDGLVKIFHAFEWGI